MSNIRQNNHLYLESDVVKCKFSDNLKRIDGLVNIILLNTSKISNKG